MASDWDQRQLCSDGSCVGVIGPDGTCKTCGRVAPNWGDERRRGQRTTAEVEPVPAVSADEDEDEDALEDDEEYEDDDEEVGEGDDEADGDDEDGDEDDEDEGDVADPRSPDEVIAAGDGPADFDSRKLCPDGGCIGVVGDNGRCRVCGKKGV